MQQIDTAVIGAGHAGLAVSSLLTGLGVEHTVLERDRVAARWRNERWDSFTLLTPNWATWLPGWHYDGTDPHGFMGRDEVVSYFERFAQSFAAPVHEGVEVQSLEPDPRAGYLLRTTDGDLYARTVVVATGPFQRPRVPSWSAGLAPDVVQVHSSGYRSPDRLPDGAVLVVGTGPSGQQIAEDLTRSGRRVYLSVGRHRRVPRRYRGRDYYWWLELGGFYERTTADVPVASRRDSVAPALTGFDGGHDLDLRQLHLDGVTLLGRAMGVEGDRVTFGGSLAESLAAGDRAYESFTDWVESRLYRFDGLFGAAEPPARPSEPPEPPGELDLRATGVSSVVWATGFGLDLERWVHLPVLDPDGYPVHDRGATSCPGLYFLGQSWLHRLRSPFIRGAAEDASHIAALIADDLSGAAGAETPGKVASPTT